MPLYEYECKRCGEKFEALRPRDDRDRAECPDCKGDGRRVLSGFAVGGGGGTSLGGWSGGGKSSCSWSGG
jgi:putative FmdB family regulatory protein